MNRTEVKDSLTISNDFGRLKTDNERSSQSQEVLEAQAAAHWHRVIMHAREAREALAEPDAAPGEGDAAWVPTALARREIAVEAGRLIAWPNYAYKHGAADDPSGETPGAARWILGPFALLPGSVGALVVFEPSLASAVHSAGSDGGTRVAPSGGRGAIRCTRVWRIAGAGTSPPPLLAAACARSRA